MTRANPGWVVPLAAGGAEGGRAGRAAAGGRRCPPWSRPPLALLAARILPPRARDRYARHYGQK